MTFFAQIVSIQMPPGLKRHVFSVGEVLTDQLREERTTPAGMRFAGIACIATTVLTARAEQAHSLFD